MNYLTSLYSFFYNLIIIQPDPIFDFLEVVVITSTLPSGVIYIIIVCTPKDRDLVVIEYLGLI